MISGGSKNGGITLKLDRGENHLNGDQALALARTRENLPNDRPPATTTPTAPGPSS